ncbi:beta strand repeat-containing protein [Pedobacter arcticus]|uniref:beta strand repeat-containing protein n=1 Tax=Pedobacter arcticus TaxID=752140 RepID=UPI0003185B79|nr:hypothetical protein [Pedobacter arcticus]
MKKIILFFFLFANVQLYAQTNGITYQAVIINPISKNAGSTTSIPLANKQICMMFKIVDANAIVEYQETSKITTDVYGLVNLIIGKGTQVGGYASTFDKINWNATTKNLIVSVDIEGACNAFTEISNQPFTAVPYALFAANTTISEASKTNKGTIQLAGDLDGIGSSANNPIISNNAVSTIKIQDGAITDAKLSSGISATKVGLGNVNNTSDTDKPISLATQTALNIKLNIADTTAMLSSYAKTASNLTADLAIVKTAIANNTAKVGYSEDLVSANPDVVANTTKVGITSAQANAIIANTAKVGITSAQAEAIITNTAKVGYTDELGSANADVVANTAKIGITSAQASAIIANTAKVGYTDELVSANADVVANTAKIGITSAQASAIIANTAKVGYTDALVSANADVVANTAKTGITSAQASAIIANTAKVGYTDALVSANADVVANTAKIGITSAQASAIIANTAKVGYTDELVSANADVVANTAKIGITSAQASAIIANTAKVGYTDALVSANADVVANTAKTGITSAQASAIIANTAKVGYTDALVSANADVVANTAKTGITSAQTEAILANTAKTGITTEQAEAILANTAKTGITTEQTEAIIANTAKTGITTEQTEAIIANTAKTGITTEQAEAIIANTAKTGITTEQTEAIIANTAKTGITTEQAEAIIANTAKTGITTEQTEAIIANTAKIGYSDDLVSANPDVIANTAALDLKAPVESPNFTGDLGGVNANFSGSLTGAKFILGTDLSLIPVDGGQSVVSSWHGLQLVGNKQSDVVDYTPVNIGENTDFSVIVPNQQAGSIGLIIKGQASQTGNLLELRDIDDTGLSAFDANGNLALGKTSASEKLDILGNIKSSGYTISSKFKTPEGTSSQFLKADGSVDENTYLSAASLESDITINSNRIGRGIGNNEENIALGRDALGTGTGSRNTAVGVGALRNYEGTSFDNNTSVGFFNSSGITTGQQNTSVGAEAMMSVTTGQGNTSVGAQSLINSSGDSNTAIGASGGTNITTGSGNTFIGRNANSSDGELSNATSIGYEAIVSESNTIQLGNSDVTKINTSATINAGGIINTPIISNTYEASTANLSNTNSSGSIIYTQNGELPNFPEDLPDGFHCTIVNYSDHPFSSNTLNSTKFYSKDTGSYGAPIFTLPSGGTAFVNVVTAGGLKRYYLSGDAVATP